MNYIQEIKEKTADVYIYIWRVVKLTTVVELWEPRSRPLVSCCPWTTVKMKSRKRSNAGLKSLIFIILTLEPLKWNYERLELAQIKSMIHQKNKKQKKQRTIKD